MNRKLRLMLLGLSSALTLAGCATLSKDQCMMGDWYDIGIQDGAAGYSPSRLAQHQEACAEFRVRPDRAAYQAGWDRGIGEYCTPDRGFQEGRRGASYGHVCPPQLEWAFLEGYRNGQQLYRQEQRLREMEAELDRKRKEARKRDDDRRKADDEYRRRADDEYRRKANDESRLRADEERRRRADDESRRKADDESRRRADDESRRKADDESRRRADEERRRKADEERRKADEERRKADEERRRNNPTIGEQPRSDYRQIQPVGPSIPIDGHADREKARRELELLQQQMKRTP